MQLKSLKNKIFSVGLAVVIAVSAGFLYLVIEKGEYRRYEQEIIFNAEKFGVDKSLVFAIIRTESNFCESAKSSKGALGIMQIMPSTASFVAEMLSLDRYNLLCANDNITLGVKYLSYLSGKFKFEEAVLAAYNAGEANARKWLNESGEGFKCDIPFKETQKYIKKVKRRKKLYKYD